MNSREKGKRGERMLAEWLRRHGYDARRGQQYSGASGDADVIGLPGYHIECKFVEHLRLRDAMAQAQADAREGEIPVVLHKVSHQPWLATLDGEDFLDLVRRAGQ